MTRPKGTVAFESLEVLNWKPNDYRGRNMSRKFWPAGRKDHIASVLFELLPMFLRLDAAGDVQDDRGSRAARTHTRHTTHTASEHVSRPMQRQVMCIVRRTVRMFERLCAFCVTVAGTAVRISSKCQTSI